MSASIIEVNYSVMIQKLDKRALALRLFGKDTEETVAEGKTEIEGGNILESEDV